MNLHAQDGAADSRWVLQLAVVLALVGLLGVEGFALASAGLGVDSDAAEVLEVAEQVYSSTGRLDRTRTAVEADVAERGIMLVDLTVEDNTLEVTVQRTADTVVLQRFFQDAAFLNPSASRSTSVRG